LNTGAPSSGVTCSTLAPAAVEHCAEVRAAVAAWTGVRTRVVFKIYVASLYLPQKAGDLAAVLSRSPRRIQLNLLRTLSADQLVEARNEGLNENNSAAELSAVQAQVERDDEALAVLLGDLYSGCRRPPQHPVLPGRRRSVHQPVRALGRDVDPGGRADHAGPAHPLPG